MPRPMGALPSPPDIRDRLFSLPEELAAVPRSVDLRHNSPLIWDQVYGSCVAEATLRAVAHAQRRQGEPVLSGSSHFTYYVGRAYHGWQNEDSGLFIRDGAKAVAQAGVTPNDFWPRTRRYDVTPDKRAYDAAYRERVVSYRRLPDPAFIHDALQAGLPVVFGMTLYPSFYQADGDGRVPYPDASETPIGGHAMLIEGFDLGSLRFTVANSWSPWWGDEGYCHMPMEMFVLDNGMLMNDLWVIELTDKE
jgi:C1A family cysteine protease